MGLADVSTQANLGTTDRLDHAKGSIPVAFWQRGRVAKSRRKNRLGGGASIRVLVRWGNQRLAMLGVSTLLLGRVTWGTAAWRKKCDD